MRAGAAVNGHQKPRQSEQMVDHNILGIVRLNWLDLQNLQLRTSRLQVVAIRPGQRPGLS